MSKIFAPRCLLRHTSDQIEVVREGQQTQYPLVHPWGLNSEGSEGYIASQIPGADFTKGLKSRFRLKFKTLGLNFVKRMLSLWSYT